jgi:hypothetical protein
MEIAEVRELSVSERAELAKRVAEWWLEGKVEKEIHPSGSLQDSLQPALLDAVVSLLAVTSQEKGTISGIP